MPSITISHNFFVRKQRNHHSTVIGFVVARAQPLSHNAIQLNHSRNSSVERESNGKRKANATECHRTWAQKKEGYEGHSCTVHSGQNDIKTSSTLALKTLVDDVVEDGKDLDQYQIKQIASAQPEHATLDRDTLFHAHLGRIFAVLGVLLRIRRVAHGWPLSVRTARMLHLIHKLPRAKDWGRPQRVRCYGVTTRLKRWVSQLRTVHVNPFSGFVSISVTDRTIDRTSWNVVDSVRVEMVKNNSLKLNGNGQTLDRSRGSQSALYIPKCGNFKVITSNIAIDTLGCSFTRKMDK